MDTNLTETGNHGFETRSFPNSLAAFYLADPISSVARMTRIDGNDEIRMANAESVQSVTSVVLPILRVYWCLFVVCLIILPVISR